MVLSIRYDTWTQEKPAGVVNLVVSYIMAGIPGYSLEDDGSSMRKVSNNHPKSLDPIQVIRPCNHHLSSHRRSSHSLKDDPNIFDQNIWKRNHMTVWCCENAKKLWSWRFTDLLLFRALLQQRRYMFSYISCHIPFLSLQTSGFIRWWDGSETCPRDRTIHVPFKYINL